ncbi:hypothetical protein IV203_005302 [Nitzschia inconspicua]|uniref:Uncharacterized protein n=1 Tax=Nitzschia inconspicua TaxID=303405 RepID=A0A9K3KM59_9STRA|nr:hypothetical protein IV203_005302 [Nitzschia inconspicua]
MDSSTAAAPLLSAIDVARECNNLGCDLLVMNNVASAIETFSLAIKLMRNISQACVDSHVHANLAKIASEYHHEARQLVQSAKTTLLGYTESSCCLKYSSRSIKLDSMRFSSGAIIIPSINRSSTILLYNMGLACLIHGKPPMLNASLPLFDMAYKLGIQAAASSTRSHVYNLEDDRSNLSTLQRICMDSLHFSAQLYHTNSDFDMADKILMELRHLVAQLPPTNDPQEQMRRHHFWILKDILQKPTLAPAA